jgi:hypothetical protein
MIPALVAGRRVSDRLGLAKSWLIGGRAADVILSGSACIEPDDLEWRKQAGLYQCDRSG